MMHPLTAVAFYFALLTCPASALGETGLRVNAATGDVRVKHMDVSQMAKIGATLVAGDSVSTGKNGRVELLMENDSLIELQSDSTFLISGTEGSIDRFNLSLGMILAKVRALAKNKRWEVRTPTAACAVRGTELAVSVDADKQLTYAGVFDEGHLEVRSDAGQTVVLDPNKETTVRDGQAPTPPQELQYFKFAAKRMAVLRSRQRYFFNQFQKKYRLPREGQ